MPLYTFVDTNTGEHFERLLSMAAREEFLKENPHIQSTILKAPGVVSGVGGIKNDGGWNETLSRIAEHHPGSALNDRYVKKTAKEVKTSQAVDKWRKTQP